MRHLLTLNDWSADQLNGLLTLAAQVKANPDVYRAGLRGKTLAMIFQKPSTRTRVSFEVGMNQLGGYGLFLSNTDMQLGRGETIPDTARVLARYVDGIMARVYAQADVEALAVGGVPVINGLSDQLHPCQALADLLTLWEHHGRLEGLTLAYVGDGTNTAHSLIHACARTGVRFRIATPEGFEADEAIVEAGRAAGGSVEVFRDPAQAVTGADAIYTDTWTSMGKEQEAAERLRLFSDYRVDRALFSKANDDALFMHCLPAHRGHEVTDDVVDDPRSVVLDEAENRLHAQKAVLLHLLGNVALPAPTPLDGPIRSAR